MSRRLQNINGYATSSTPAASSHPSSSALSLDLNAGAIQLGQVAIPATGGWQNWTTVSHNVNVSAGTYSLGIYVPQAGWNINWLRITKL